MKSIVSILLILIFLVSKASGTGDNDSIPRKSFFKHKKEYNTTTIVTKMSDAQLYKLIDYMFDAQYIPPDLWSQVLMESTRRHLTKSVRSNFNDILVTRRPLCIDKISPDYVSPNQPDSMSYYPGSAYYNEWDEDYSSLFKDEFPRDTTYTLQMENSDFGCYNMPSWGPLSSPFGWRHNRYHKGIDIQLRKGDTITCAFDGMVRFAQKKGGYGNVVIVRHYNGLETVYAHLSKIKVQEGDVLGAGDLVGLAGTTGHSTGPHLHFEIRFKGLAVDPLFLISYDYGSLKHNTITFKKNKSGLLSAFSPLTEFHKVERGETIMDIAYHYGTTSAKIRQLNGIAPKQHFRLKKDMVLRVRAIARTVSASSK